MQNQELKVYLSSLIQTIESNQKLDLIKDYVEQITNLKENSELEEVKDLSKDIHYSFKIK